ncbi:Stk1 family PASTA domain-containing Ser/Thr kinase [Streptomyces sp. 142MFCol3.1]|uniref:Stk1 family PASTA domain-containing Ser/Thr kinase n=1 Tax=Streptomyces sp. 142MFCol3.1 TaxID=1172179 RepID=UPI0003FC3E55|nr:Stk1 family PASTA domain-containing Ser/Thr kinase [Streptomyces sp. 142MFCol3.1]
MSPTAAQRLLRDDPRTADIAARETVALPLRKAEALLHTLRAGETVLALYHQGLGYAALTEEALVLLGGDAPTRVPRPLTILRTAYGAQRRVDLSVTGRRITVWGSQLDTSGELVQHAGKLVSDSLAADPRTASADADENISLPDDHKKVLLAELEPDEVVRSLYHCGWGYAALTDRGLILLRPLLTPKASRAPKPLRIQRRAHGLLDRVDIVVDGTVRKLHGSKIDPKGELLEAVGDILPADAPVRSNSKARWVIWLRRHPVLLAAVVAGTLVSGLSSVSNGHDDPARAGADTSLAVPDFSGASVAEAVADAEAHAWLKVSAADASSAFRPVKNTASGWQVCFQTPSREETVRPSVRTLTLYAVPRQEVCPAQLLGPRRVAMPDLVGKSLEEAVRALEALDLDHPAMRHAYTDKRLESGSHDLDQWHVCRQQPESGTAVLVSTQVGLWLIDPGAPCTRPSPVPTPKPKPKPKPRPEPSHGSIEGGAMTGGGASAGPTGSGGSTSGGSTRGGSSSTSGGTAGGSGSQSGIQFGQYCSPVGATATTADGRPAKCYMGKDGRARWGYDSR